MQLPLIDTHAHVYLPQFDGDRPAVMQRAVDAGVEQIYLPAIDAETHGAMLQTERDYPFCKSMMGLHPCSVKQDFEEELRLVKAHLAARDFIAVGEIGLDFHWDKTFAQQQYDAFHRQVGWALQYDRPVVIHSRNAVDECIGVVAQYPGLRGVFHCFSGTAEQAQKIAALGFHLGIGGVATFKNGGLDKVLPQTGLPHLLLETDAPYLAPVPHRGKRNEPAYTATVAARVAELLSIDVAEVARQTTANAKNLFSFGQKP